MTRNNGFRTLTCLVMTACLVLSMTGTVVSEDINTPVQAVNGMINGTPTQTIDGNIDVASDHNETALQVRDYAEVDADWNKLPHESTDLTVTGDISAKGSSRVTALKVESADESETSVTVEGTITAEAASPTDLGEGAGEGGKPTTSIGVHAVNKESTVDVTVDSIEASGSAATGVQIETGYDAVPYYNGRQIEPEDGDELYRILEDGKKVYRRIIRDGNGNAIGEDYYDEDGNVLIWSPVSAGGKTTVTVENDITATGSGGTQDETYGVRIESIGEDSDITFVSNGDITALSEDYADGVQILAEGGGKVTGQFEGGNIEVSGEAVNAMSVQTYEGSIDLTVSSDVKAKGQDRTNGILLISDVEGEMTAEITGTIRSEAEYGDAFGVVMINRGSELNATVAGVEAEAGYYGATGVQVSAEAGQPTGLTITGEIKAESEHDLAEGVYADVQDGGTVQVDIQKDITAISGGEPFADGGGYGYTPGATGIGAYANSGTIGITVEDSISAEGQFDAEGISVTTCSEDSQATVNMEGDVTAKAGDGSAKAITLQTYDTGTVEVEIIGDVSAVTDGEPTPLIEYSPVGFGIDIGNRAGDISVNVEGNVSGEGFWANGIQINSFEKDAENSVTVIGDVSATAPEEILEIIIPDEGSYIYRPEAVAAETYNYDSTITLDITGDVTAKGTDTIGLEASTYSGEGETFIRVEGDISAESNAKPLETEDGTTTDPSAVGIRVSNGGGDIDIYVEGDISAEGEDGAFTAGIQTDTSFGWIVVLDGDDFTINMNEDETVDEFRYDDMWHSVYCHQADGETIYYTWIWVKDDDGVPQEKFVRVENEYLQGATNITVHGDVTGDQNALRIDGTANENIATNIVVDGTVSAENDTAIVFAGREGTDGKYDLGDTNVVVWGARSGGETGNVASIETEEGFFADEDDENAAETLKDHINYIIRWVEGIVSLDAGIRTFTTAMAGDYEETFYVASEDEDVAFTLTAEEDQELTGVYYNADDETTLVSADELETDNEGNFLIRMLRGGFMNLSAAFHTHTPDTRRVDVVDATCTEDGSYTEETYCTGCKKVLKRETGKVIEATGHSFTEYASDNNATCTEDGTKTAECDHCCGTKDTVADKGSAKGHKAGAEVIENYVDATSGSEGGYDVVVYCTECGTELHRDHVILEIVPTPEPDPTPAVQAADPGLILKETTDTDETSELKELIGNTEDPLSILPEEAREQIPADCSAVRGISTETLTGTKTGMESSVTLKISFGSQFAEDEEVWLVFAVGGSFYVLKGTVNADGTVSVVLDRNMIDLLFAKTFVVIAFGKEAVR